jgi:hypothetical protein
MFEVFIELGIIFVLFFTVVLFIRIITFCDFISSSYDKIECEVIEYREKRKKELKKREKELKNQPKFIFQVPINQERSPLINIPFLEIIKSLSPLVPHLETLEKLMGLGLLNSEYMKKHKNVKKIISCLSMFLSTYNMLYPKQKDVPKSKDTDANVESNSTSTGHTIGVAGSTGHTTGYSGGPGRHGVAGSTGDTNGFTNDGATNGQGIRDNEGIQQNVNPTNSVPYKPNPTIYVDNEGTATEEPPKTTPISEYLKNKSKERQASKNNNNNQPDTYDIPIMPVLGAMQICSLKIIKYILT